MVNKRKKGLRTRGPLLNMVMLWGKISEYLIPLCLVFCYTLQTPEENSSFSALGIS